MTIKPFALEFSPAYHFDSPHYPGWGYLPGCHFATLEEAERVAKTWNDDQTIWSYRSALRSE